MASQCFFRVLFCAILSALNSGVTGLVCDQVSFNRSSIVCRCNATYCDTVPELKLSANSYTIYTSTMAGDRFANKIVPFSSKTSTATGDVKVDKSTKYQDIIGFGGAITDSAALNVFKLSFRATRKLLQSYYSPDGIEYTLGRVPEAGSGFSLRNYTYDDVNGDIDLDHFALAPEDRLLKIPLLKLAKRMSRRNIKLFSTPFGASYWMKRSGSASHGGFIKGKPGGDYYKTYANYNVKFLDAYKKNGIEFWGMTTENEPIFGLLHLVPVISTAFTGTVQKDYIAKDLGPALEAAGYGHLKLIIYDENTFWPARWAKAVYGDQIANQYTSGLGLHWYLNKDTGYDVMTETHNIAPDKFILSTEACVNMPLPGEGPVELGSWERGEAYFHDIIKTLQNWVAGWTDWNIALDMEGGPTWVDNFVDSPIIVNSQNDEFYKQPMFYAMGHFSKFVTPNSIRHQMTLTGTNIDGVVFSSPENNTVMILYNDMDTEEVVKITDGPKVFSVTVKARSFNTLIYQN
ncbi:lysosomal acid glucosylceramidase-like [Watersipora subatra]|uniref:lysosomal acid glucosylceramidase-like n=1 Tax=Watersipora subatra TaxID=2589382 RepID=UPI00355B01D1